MFVVNDMPKQIDRALVELLEQAETATIGHVLYEGFVDRGIAALLPKRRVAGTAVTLRLPHADSTLLHYACKLVRPGDVVLIDRSGDSKYACWGGGLSRPGSSTGRRPTCRRSKNSICRCGAADCPRSRRGCSASRAR